MLLNVLQTKLYIVLSDAIMLHDIQRKAGSLAVKNNISLAIPRTLVRDSAYLP